MIEKLLYICPICFTEDGIKTVGKKISCIKCGAILKRSGDKLDINGEKKSYAEWYSVIKNFELKPIVMEDEKLKMEKDEVIYKKSKTAILRQGKNRLLHYGFGRIFSYLELPTEIDRGNVLLTNKRMIFNNGKEQRSWKLEDLRCVTTNSKYFEFKVKDEPFYQLHFLEETALKYDECIKKILERFYKENFYKEIIEFQPKIIFRNSKVEKKTVRISKKISSFTDRKSSNVQLNVATLWENILGGFIKFVFRQFFKIYNKTKIIGEENIPKTGPFIILINHEGYFDPMILMSYFKRKVSFLTKNTAYSSGFLRWVMKFFRSIPVRRYEIDPSVIRNIMKILSRGDAIGIFPEGERTWDGEMLPFKRGTLKFLIVSKMPIIVCKIEGSYHFLPRWEHKIMRWKVTAKINKPISLDFDVNQIDEAEKFLKDIFKN
jgi:1-acyl-sn-glycerol-3-phosphate acyltransferase